MFLPCRKPIICLCFSCNQIRELFFVKYKKKKIFIGGKWKLVKQKVFLGKIGKRSFRWISFLFFFFYNSLFNILLLLFILLF